MALFLSGVGVTEALSWLPLRTTPLIPLRCEFCGTPLDPRTSRCPHCEALPDVSAQEKGLLPPEAILLSLVDETRFDVKPDRTTVVGRGSTRNDVNLSNPTVSRHHAQISYEQGRYVLTALRDLNGTFVNDSLIRKRVLEEGDEIRFGRARFRFELMES
jgi:pSer/pThr/pTyr-binding forkhead associated (FHA) protein